MGKPEDSELSKKLKISPEISRILKNRGINVGDVLGNSIEETSNKYGLEHGKEALKRYILENDINLFTRQNNSRMNMREFMTPATALEKVIEEMIEKEIGTIEKTTLDLITFLISSFEMPNSKQRV